MSRRRPSRRKYAETIGEIAIEWNLLERRMDALAFHYIGGDDEVAHWILQGMGNQTKGELLKYLVKRFERDNEISALIEYLLRATNTLCNNRNILLHASPVVAFMRYRGRIVKPHKHGQTKHFNVPIEVLEQTAKSLRDFASYALLITMCVIAPDNLQSNDEFHTREALKRTLASSPPKPPLPRKIDPVQTTES